MWRELFLDTGVGVDAYSVIEQGRVAAMLDANPEERRLIFEEAAGISKFKARKKESERKLEKSRSECPPRQRHRRGSRQTPAQRKKSRRPKPAIIRNSPRNSPSFG